MRSPRENVYFVSEDPTASSSTLLGQEVHYMHANSRMHLLPAPNRGFLSRENSKDSRSVDAGSKSTFHIYNSSHASRELTGGSDLNKSARRLTEAFNFASTSREVSRDDSEEEPSHIICTTNLQRVLAVVTIAVSVLAMVVLLATQRVASAGSSETPGRPRPGSLSGATMVHSGSLAVTADVPRVALTPTEYDPSESELRTQIAAPPPAALPPPTPSPPEFCNKAQALSEKVSARKVEPKGDWAGKCMTESHYGRWMPPSSWGSDAARNWCWVEMKRQADKQRFEPGRNEKPPNWWGAQTAASDVHMAPNPWEQVVYALFDHEVCDIESNGRTMFNSNQDPAKLPVSTWEEAKRWFAKTVQVYVINLPSNTARMNAISARLRTLGIDFERLDGVDMRVEGELQRSKAAGQVPAEWDVDAVKKTLREQFTYANGYIPTGFIDQIGMGTAGCTAAHLRAMKTASKSEKPLAIILEDDANLVDDFIPKLWALVTDEVPCDWEVINLDLYFPYGKCISPHLARIHPDGNEPKQTCGHGANWSFAAVLYKVSQIPKVIEELSKVVWDMSRPACLVHDIAFASLADRIVYYAVPAQQNPGLVTTLHVKNDISRESINR